jgi:hypothetical protein
VFALTMSSAFVRRRSGRIGASGVLTIDYPIGDLIGPEPGWIWYVRVICHDPTRPLHLTTPQQVLVENT